MCDNDGFRDFILLKLDEEKFFLKPCRDTDGDPDRPSPSYAKADGGVGSAPLGSAELAPGAGEGAGLAD